MRYMFLIYSRETDMAGMTVADVEALIRRELCAEEIGRASCRERVS